MFSTLYSKTLYNLRWQLLGWGVGVGFIAFVTMAFYNSFNQDGIENVVNSVPDSLRSLIGSVEDFKTIPGYIGQQIFGPNGYIVAVAGSIIIAVSVSASEEDDKRLQTLVTLPLTRSAIFLHKWLAVLTSVVVLTALLVVGIFLGLLIVGHSADFHRVIDSAAAFFLMNSAFATITFGTAMFIGKKGISIGIAGGYAALSFLISSLAPSVDALKDVDKFSVLHYYNNPLIMQHGLDAGHILTLVGVIVVIAAISWVRFRQRNIGV